MLKNMYIAAEFIALAHEVLSILDYTAHFCQLAQCYHYDNETLKSLYWEGANCYTLLDLPE